MNSMNNRLKKAGNTMILFLTTTCKERVSAMTMTISRAIEEVRKSCVKKETAHFVLAYTDGYFPFKELSWLEILASDPRYSVKIQISWLNAEGMSVAQTKKHSDLEKIEWDSFVNLDDDLWIHPRVIQFIMSGYSNSEFNQVRTFGCWDPKNIRNYSDWDSTVYPSLLEFRKVHHNKHAKVHLFKKEEADWDYQWLSQLYQMSYQTWRDPAIWKPVLKKFNKPGIRGYDIELEKQVIKQGYKIVYVTGCESIHFGLEEGYLGSKWIASDQVVNDNVSFKE
jgi:hypothetical protein